MSEVRLIDANALRKNMEFICMGIMAGTDSYNAPLTEIDSAPTVEPEITEKQAITKIINSGWLVKHDKELLEKWERPQGEWIDYDNTFYKCPECGYLLEKCCPQCQNKVILPKGGAE